MIEEKITKKDNIQFNNVQKTKSPRKDKEK